jgi:hypothetical protein
VHDAVSVRVCETVADLIEHAEDAVEIELGNHLRIARDLFVDDLATGEAGNFLHREVKAAFEVVANVVHRHRGGVLQLSGDARLAHEPRVHVLVVGQMRVQRLHDHRAAEVLVLARAEDGRAAGGERMEVAVAAEAHGVVRGELGVGILHVDVRIGVLRAVARRRGGLLLGHVGDETWRLEKGFHSVLQQSFRASLRTLVKCMPTGGAAIAQAATLLRTRCGAMVAPLLHSSRPTSEIINSIREDSS